MGDSQLACTPHELSAVASCDGGVHRLEVDCEDNRGVGAADVRAELELLQLVAAPNNGAVVHLAVILRIDPEESIIKLRSRAAAATIRTYARALPR